MITQKLMFGGFGKNLLFHTCTYVVAFQAKEITRSGSPPAGCLSCFRYVPIRRSGLAAERPSNALGWTRKDTGTTIAVTIGYQWVMTMYVRVSKYLVTLFSQNISHPGQMICMICMIYHHCSS